MARKQAEQEQEQRQSIIPGPAPDEVVIPATVRRCETTDEDGMESRAFN